MVSGAECIPHRDKYTTDVITDGAIQFLNSYTKNGSKNPFYLSVHYTAPHKPYVGEDGKAESMHPKEYVDMYEKASFVSCPQETMKLNGNPCLEKKYNRECLKGYYAAVTAMDMNIGRIMDTLRELNLDENTLILFTSDHGFNAGHHGIWGKGNAVYPLNVMETTLKIPMIWRHAGTIKPGVEESVVQVLDIAPTILDYAGKFSFPKFRNVTGESFASLLLKPTQRNSMTTRTIYGEYGATRYVRINGTMKYVSRLIEGEKLKAASDDEQQQLFDLKADSNEAENLLYSNSSNVAKYNGELKYLEKRLQEWFAKYENPIFSSWRKYVGGRGQYMALTHKCTSDEDNLKAPFNKHPRMKA